MPRHDANLLIVDNDPLMLTGMAAVLDRERYICHCAQDAEAARKAALAIAPDLMICEINLPGRSGLELHRELVDSAELADMPVFFLSSGGDPRVVDLVRQVGGAYYLAKPFDPNVLIEMVNRAMWMPHLVRNQIQTRRRATRAPSSPIG